MRKFFVWIDPKYLAILLAVVAIFIYDSQQAQAPERLLKKVASSKDASLVVAHLADPDVRIADAAKENISRNPNAFLDALISALMNDDKNIKAAALKSIIDYGLKVDEDIVRPLLDSESPPLRVQALRYLAQSGEKIELEKVEKIFTGAMESTDKVAVIQAAEKVLSGDDAAVFLITALADPDKDVKLAVFDTARKTQGDTGVMVLIECLYYDDITAPLAEIELKRRGREASELLINALEDNRNAVRARAAGLLGDIGDKRALQSLIDLFTNTSYDVRKAAGRSAGKLADEAHLQGFLGGIQTAFPDSIISVAEIYALGSAQWLPSAQRVMQIALDPGFQKILRYSAFDALGEMGYTPAESFLLARASDEMEEEDIRREAIEALGWFTSDESLDFLGEMLRYPANFDFKIAAAHALGIMKRKEALETLMSAVETEKTGIVITELVHAMAAHGDPAAIPAIKAACAKFVREIDCDVALRQIEFLSGETEVTMH